MYKNITNLSSLILSLLILIPLPCFGFFESDFNQDGDVNVDDLIIMGINWLNKNEPGCVGDTNGDCSVMLADIAILNEQWQFISCPELSAAASSIEDGTLGPENAIDEEISTRWSSAFADNQSITVDMGKVIDFNEITILWEAAYAKKYDILISTNGSSWTTVHAQNNGNGGFDIISIGNISARYIQVKCIQRATIYGFSIFEITFSGDTFDTCLEPPVDPVLPVWADEFNGTTLDLTKWTHQLGTGSEYGLIGWGNNEHQYYRSQNATVSGGFLSITAKKQNYGGKEYTSARLRTLYKGDFQYGRFEARIKLPSAQGMWPAFWMLPTDSSYGGWASSGEIDIIEAANVPYSVDGTLHFGGPWPGNTCNCGGSHYATGDNLGDEFHIYAIEWEATEFRWYVDDNHYKTAISSDWWSSQGGGLAPFDNPFHMLLNLAVGGNYPCGGGNNCIDDNALPATMLVDYVRVYDLE